MFTEVFVTGRCLTEEGFIEICLAAATRGFGAPHSGWTNLFKLNDISTYKTITIGVYVITKIIFLFIRRNSST